MNNVLVIGIGGVPASGKTTLFKMIRDRLFRSATEFEFFPEYMKGKGLNPIRGIQKDSIYMLGVFDGSMFEGTDRLGMSSSPVAKEFIDTLPDKSVVIFEGARFFTKSFMLDTNTLPMIISASEEEIQRRMGIRASKGKVQNKTFLKGRKTAIDRIAKEFCVEPFVCDTIEELESVANSITQKVVQWIE